MWVIGDTHGKIEEFNNLLERRVLSNCEPDELIVQVGDMACGMPKVFVPHFPPNVRWFRGNHDNPEESRSHPNYMGYDLSAHGQGMDYGYSEKHKMFWMAGAWSIDWLEREINRKQNGRPRTWWPGEQLDQEDLDRALALYIETQPEIVLSHEAPASIVPEVLWTPMEPTGIPGIYVALPSIKPGEPMYEPEMAELRAKTGYYARKEKLGCVETRTAQTLQRMLNHHAPKYWVFGHYHISKQFRLGGTIFKCCAELEPYRIEEEL